LRTSRLRRNTENSKNGAGLTAVEFDIATRSGRGGVPVTDGAGR
jgi:hypothetical protein